MSQHFKIAIVCSLLLMITIPSSAEFYQYVDSKGITHFTDSISTIPTEYKSQLERHPKIISLQKESVYIETDDSEAGIQDFFFETDNQTYDDTAIATDSDFTESKPIALKSAEKAKYSGISKLVPERKILIDKKQALNKKFEMLAAEKQQLEKNKGDMRNEESIARYNKRVKKMNEKIKLYKKEEKRFKTEIEIYNEQKFPR